MRRSSRPISASVNARAGGAVGAERLSIVIQQTRQLRMQKTESRLARRWAVRSFDSCALQPDLGILWNTSIFHLKKNLPFELLNGVVLIQFGAIEGRDK